MERNCVVFLGPPGAGKGTQSYSISKALDIPHISPGNMIRSAMERNMEINNRAKKEFENGEFSSEDVTGLIRDRILGSDCERGYILDGYPRYMEQVDDTKSFDIGISHVIDIYVPLEESIKRICGRRVHPTSGRIYHDFYNPPRCGGLDDVTGEKLIHRDDDREEVIRKRWGFYEQYTAVLTDYYMRMANEIKFIRILGIGSVGSITKKILSFIKGENL